MLDRPIVMPWIRLDRDPDAEEALALSRAKQPWLAGFCLFGGDADRVARLTRRLCEEAGRQLLVASDMERGAGQQVRGLSVLPDAAVWGLGGSPIDARAFGEITAREARSVGVNVLFAPVLDVRSHPGNPIVGNRAFAWDPDRVASMGAAYVRGALDGGCAPTGKHFPGHGATSADSHDAVPVVADPADLLRARDVAPFAAAIAAGCPAIMTAHVAYPALEPSGAIATFSRAALDLARELAEDVDSFLTAFTDALLMAGAATPGGEVEAARRALRAGCDVLLIPSEPERLAAEVLACDDPSLPGAADLAAARANELRQFIDEALTTAPLRSDDGLRSVPGRVADRAARLAGLSGLSPLGEGDTLVLLDDDDLADRGRVLDARAREAGARVVVARIRRDGPPPRDLEGVEADAVVVFASVRAWKGSGHVSPAGLEALARVRGERTPVVGLTPRADGMTFHLPGTGPDVESAVADYLFAR